MNLFITKSLFTTRFVACLTVFSMIVSALPAPFFVNLAQAEDGTEVAGEAEEPADETESDQAADDAVVDEESNNTNTETDKKTSLVGDLLRSLTTQPESPKVTICHSAGQSGNYTKNEVDQSAVLGTNGPNGHGDHSNDIIPPFENFTGQNWNTLGQAIWNANCSVAVAPEIPSVPQCDLGAETVADTTFDTFNLGNVNGQNNWKSTGAFDQEVVTNIYGYSTFGCKSLRISNAVTSGSFGDQTFAAPLTDSVGETIATNGSFSAGTKYNRFEAQFDVASTKSTVQTGMRMTVSPDRGDGSRMSFLAFQDVAGGIDVVFNEVQGAADADITFVPTTIATINRTTPHTIKWVVNTNEGPSNDVVQVYIDGVLKYTGTSWENYYRFDSESASEQTPRIIKTLLFRSSGTAAPATDGEGFLFDNMSFKALNQPAEATVVATKIVCDKESKLPNYGLGGPAMTANTAADFVAQNPGCSLQKGWEFEWGNQNAPNAGDAFVGSASAMGYTTFTNSTNGSGVATQTIPLANLSEIHLREVLKAGYIPFTNGATPDNSNNVSAEFYCSEDTLNYDNWDFIRNPQAGATYYCVAWNAPIENPVTPICETGKNLLQNGSFENTPTVTDHGGQWQIFATISDWFVGLSDGIEVWNTFNGVNDDVASNGVQNVELDGNNATRLTQSAVTIPGATYEIKFDFSPRATIGAADNVMAVLVDGATVDTINGDGTGTTTNSWAPKSKTFVAASTSTEIGFEDLGTANDNGGYGPLLDNVALCLVKEPEPLPTCTLTLKSDVTDYVVEKNAMAKLMSYIHPSWVTAIGTSSAAWIWGDNPVVNPLVSESQTFKKSFNWTGGTVTSATLKLASDNSHEVKLGSYVNGNPGEFNYGAVTSYDVATSVVNGLNTLAIEVENFAQVNGTQTSNPAGLIYELTITGTGKSCGTVVPEVPKTTGTVTMCKVDMEDEPLSGWTLTLLGNKVEDVVVSANSSAGVNTIAALNAGKSYVAKASGTWTNDRTPNPINLVDAEYSTEDTWATQMDGFGSDTNILELRVNDVFDPSSNWGAYNSAHTYAQSFVQAATGSANFRVFDSFYGDNSGSLNVQVNEGYAGITGENGCVTFTNVPFGTYTAGEIMQDGWKNKSGIGEVKVDAVTEEFTIINEEDEDGGGDDEDTYTISGSKWNDLDADGLWDKGEPAIAGWGISLYQLESLVATTTTDADGDYSFEVEEGDYYVVEETRDNWTQTGLYQNPENVGDDETPNSCYFEVAESEDDPLELSAISGYLCEFGNHYINPNQEIDQCEIGENLLTNGSFEDPLVTDVVNNYQVFAAVPGWGISLPDGMELWNSALFGNASEGNQLTELDVINSTEISQTITTTIGDEYTVSFDFSARPDTNIANNAMEVTAGGVIIGSVSADGTGTTTTSWNSHSFTFTATTTSTVVTFKDVGTSNGVGTLLDNTKVCVTGLNTPNNGGGNGGNGGGGRRTPQGEVAGDSISTTPVGEVLGAQVTMMPAGAPNAGAGSTSTNLPFMLMLITLAGLAFSSMRAENVEIKKS